MSLIADALKRAQEQRAEGRDGKDDDDRARRMLSGSGPVRIDRAADRLSPSVAAAGVVLLGALATFGAVVWLAPGGDDGGDGGTVASSTSRGVEPRPTAAGEGGAPGRAASPGAEQPSGADVGLAGDPGTGAGPRPGGGGSTGAAGVAGPSGSGQPADASPSAARRTDPTSRATGGPGAAAGGAGAGDRAAIGPVVTGAEAGESPSFVLRLQGREQAAPMDASELFGRALGAQQAGDLGAAASLYRRAIERNPSDAQLHNNLGTVYRRLDMPGQALAAFRQAVTVDPSYAPAWSNLGIMLDALGRNEEAISAFREALRHEPSNNGARVNLANKYIGIGLVDDAIGLLRDVLRDAPALPEAHYAMARARETAGETTEAIRHYRIFLELADGRFPALEQRVAGHLAELEGGGG